MTSWATSSDVFQARWNGSVADVYRINGFHPDAQGKDAGDFTGGSVYRVSDTTYAAITHDRDQFESICTHSVQAALGMPADSASALVKAAIDQGDTDPDGNGFALFEAFEVSVSATMGGRELDCIVERTGTPK